MALYSIGDHLRQGGGVASEPRQNQEQVQQQEQQQEQQEQQIGSVHNVRPTN
jgi:hypothetical protein